MSLPFKIIERGEPGVVGGGVKKFYASMKSQSTVDIDQLTRDIERTSTVSGADIRAVLYAMVEVMTDRLGDGHIIRLGELGHFRAGLSSNGVATQAEVNASVIKGAHILFTPGQRIKTMLRGITYHKA